MKVIEGRTVYIFSNKSKSLIEPAKRLIPTAAKETLYRMRELGLRFLKPG